MSRIGQRRVDHFGRTVVSPFNEMARAYRVFADGRDVFVAFNCARDRDIAILARLGGRREEMKSEFLQCLALLFISLFVNVNVIEVPLAERFEHALVLGALDELGHRQSFERNLAVVALADEYDLRPVAGHARRQGLKPARTGWTAGTSFLEFPAYLPGGFGRCGCRSTGNAECPDAKNDCKRDNRFGEGNSFHKFFLSLELWIF